VDPAADGNDGINWSWSQAQPDTWITAYPNVAAGTTYTASVAFTGTGQISLDFFDGNNDNFSPTVTPQTVSVSVTVVNGRGSPQLQIRTPSGGSDQDLNVTATDLTVVSNPPTLAGNATLIADADEDVTQDNASGIPIDLGNGGPGSAATLNTPSAVAVDAEGDVFIADTENNMVREVTPNGIISTIAGTGQPGYSGDGGPATAAELDGPAGLATDANGDLFIADTVNNVIREVTPNGTITTIAGDPTTGASAGQGGPLGGGFAGDGGPANQSLLVEPQGAGPGLGRATCTSPTPATA
jgi:hypothetical protein